MAFVTISEPDQPDYEIWTCDSCGYQITLAGVGGDVAECPNCIRLEEEARAEEEENRYFQEEIEREEKEEERRRLREED
jgi:hypothetical protein